MWRFSWAEIRKFHIIDARLCFGICVIVCVCVGGPSHSSHTPLGFVLFGDFFLTHAPWDSWWMCLTIFHHQFGKISCLETFKPWEFQPWEFSEMVGWKSCTTCLWTPKPWNMKVLGPKNMGYKLLYTPKNEGCRFPWWVKITKSTSCFPHGHWVQLGFPSLGTISPHLPCQALTGQREQLRWQKEGRTFFGGGSFLDLEFWGEKWWCFEV